MNDRALTIAQITGLCQRAGARELDLVWRFLCAMLDGKGAVA